MADEAKNEIDAERTVLLTGGTGVFGEYLIYNLLRQKNIHIILIVRAPTHEKARERIQHVIGSFENVEVFGGDLNQHQLGLSEQDYRMLTYRVTHILHSAASTRFNHSIEEIRRFNVETTKEMLLFAKSCHQLQRFGYVSSALVAGKRSGTIFEEEFEHSEGFLNTYQQSKYEAEALVRSYEHELPISIFRPPLLIHPFKKKSGRPTNLLTLSIFLIRKGFLPILPGTESSSFDIMDGEVVADAIVRLLLKKRLFSASYHITSGKNTLTVGNIVRFVEEHIQEKLPIRFVGDTKSFDTELKKMARKNPALPLIYKKTSTFLPELMYPKIYDNKNTCQELDVEEIHHNAEEKLRSIIQ